MIRNYLKTAVRTLRREKGYVGLNVLGLGVALAACVLIALYIRHELSYDRFHEDADRLYRIVQASEAPGPEIDPGIEGYASLAEGMVRTVEMQVPGIKRLTNVHDPGNDKDLFRIAGESHLFDRFYHADSSFFQVLSFDLVRGNPKTALAEPGQIVLTESLATRIFGDEDPIGKTMTKVVERRDQRTDYVVSGVMADPPETSSIQPQAVLSLTPIQRERRYSSEISWNFFVGGGYAFAELEPTVDPSDVQRALAEIRDAKAERFLALQPLTSMHLHSNLRNEIAPTGNLQRLYLFGAIGFLLLLIAVVNYVNLSTARSARRTREVGVRKTVGAERGQVAGQFLCEAVLMALLAVPVVVGLVRFGLPLLEQLTGQALTLAPLWSARGLGLLLGGAVLIGVLSGAYPALVLSAPRPVQILRGHTASLSRGRPFLRQGLVVFQFAASIVLIACTLVVYHQLQYVQDASLGFDAEHVVTFDIRPMGEDYAAFKSQLEGDTRLQSISSGAPLGLGWRTTSFPKSIISDVAPDSITVEEGLSVINVDYDYVETTGLSLRSGQSFASERGAENELLLTKSTVQVLGLPEQPIGETTRLGGGTDRRVVGVVDDIQNNSLHDAGEHVAIRLRPGNNGVGLTRLVPGRTSEGLAALEEAWNAVLPNRPFTYRFLDDRIDAQYRSDRRAGRLFGVFAGLAIFVAGLGLFGLAAYAAHQRRREIAIRKVLGATVQSVVGLLSKDFLKLVAVAFVLAAPVAYVAAQRWLEDFAYRIELGPWIFLLAGLAAVLVALLSVSTQALRAAWTDPATAIRQE